MVVEVGKESESHTTELYGNGKWRMGEWNGISVLQQSTHLRVGPLKSSLTPPLSHPPSFTGHPSKRSATLSIIHQSDWLERCHSNLCRAASLSKTRVRRVTGSPETQRRERERERSEEQLCNGSEDLTMAFQVDERTHLQLHYLQRHLSNRVEPSSGVRGHNGCGRGQQTQLEIASITCSL